MTSRRGQDSAWGDIRISISASDLLLREELWVEEAEQFLSAFGFENPSAADRNLQLIADTAESRLALADIIEPLLFSLSKSPDPDGALNNFERLTHVTTGKLSLLRYLKEDPGGIETLCMVMGASQYAADTLYRHPEYLELLLREGFVAKPKSYEQLRKEAAKAVQPFESVPHKLDALRRMKHREMLRIIAADVMRLASFESVTQQLSDLADVLVSTALEVCLQVSGFQGSSEQCGFLVVAMGKLGGRELNYSSDIDLIFFYDYDEEKLRRRWADNPFGLAVGAEELIAQRLAERLVEALGKVTEDGRLYRVDMRLRPYGSRGPLALSWESALTYYESWSEPWERQALLKARPIAGDVPLALRVQRFLEGFTYDQPLGAEEIQEIERVKRRAEGWLSEAGKAEGHVKAGPGGIRDVEYTVQLLQLVTGARQLQVRTGNTLWAMEALHAAGVLLQREFEALREGYIFLRELEHRLQIAQDLPLHHIPNDPQRQRHLAKQMGYKGEQAAQQLLLDFDRHSQRVRNLHERIFSEIAPRQPKVSAEWEELLDLPSSDPKVEQRLQPWHFSNPKRAHEDLRLLFYGPASVSLPLKMRATFLRLLPKLLGAAARAPSPDRALENLERIASAVGNRTNFIESLARNETVLESLLKVCAVAAYLVELMVRHPEHVEILIGAGWDSRALGSDGVSQKFWKRLGVEKNGNGRVEGWRRKEAQNLLRRVRNLEVLLTGFSDLTGLSDTYQTMLRLTALADGCLRTALEFCLRADGLDGKVAITIIGLGGLGAAELHYTSDLDVVFAYDDSVSPLHHSVSPLHHSVSPLHHSVSPLHPCVERVVEQVVHFLSDLTEEGIAYRIDLRLRPGGRGGALAQSLTGWALLFRDAFEPWFALALPRARFSGGDEECGRAWLNEVHRMLYQAPLKDTLSAQLLHLNERIVREHAPPPNMLEPKHSRGGLFDIEFVVALMQLTWGYQYEPLRSSNAVNVLQALEKLGLMSESEAKQLLRDYLFLRHVKNRLTLLKPEPVISLPCDDEDFPLLTSAILNHPQPELAVVEFERRWREVTDRTQAICENLRKQLQFEMR